MNRIDQYFTSPIKMMGDNQPHLLLSPSSPTNAHRHRQQQKQQQQHNNNISDDVRRSSNSKTESIVDEQPAVPAPINGLSSSPAISKMIVSNMASVISSVEKKQKKQRRKQRKLAEPDICDISNILCNSLKFVGTNTEDRSLQGSPVPGILQNGQDALTDSLSSPKPSSQTSIKMTPIKSTTLSNERHCNSTDAKENNVLNVAGKLSKSDEPQLPSTAATAVDSSPIVLSNKTPKKNAFEFLMNARNKIMSPAKNDSASGGIISPTLCKASSASKTKRKLMLDDLATTRKNNNTIKRKAPSKTDEDLLNGSSNVQKRAKRLKKMPATDDAADGPSAASLSNDTNKSPSNETMLFDDDDDNDDDGSNEANSSMLKFNFKKINDSSGRRKSLKKKSKLIDATKEVTDECLVQTKSPQTPKKMAAAAKGLASPSLKKRDSLLGYFVKIDKTPTSLDEPSPPTMIENPPLGQKRGSGRRRKIKSKSTRRPSMDEVNTVQPAPAASTTPSDRPKRSCREKVQTYAMVDTEQHISPVKVAAQKSLKRARRLLSGGSLSPAKSPGKRTQRKLASIFVKTAPKPTVDPEVAKARHTFLMSGIPDRMRADIERQRAYIETFECEAELFPTVSHVRQASAARRPTVEYTIKFRIDDDDDFNADWDTKAAFVCGAQTSKITNAELKRTEPTNDRQLVDPNTLVRRMKQEDDLNFLHFRCYKRLRRKNHQNKMASMDSVDHDDSVQFVDDTDLPPGQMEAVNGCEMFTEKYRPTTTEEIIVNAEPVIELRNFLTNWHEAAAAAGAAAAATTPKRRGGGRRRRCASTDDSDDDFISDGDTTTTTMPSIMKNAVLLLGPPSSGKTSAVFAVANELNFKVLEVNAGAKRTGRKILQELHEATQSHQVKGGSGGGPESRQLFRVHSQEAVESCSGGGGGSQQQPTFSLILIEDADIAFEQDIGFVDAINQLVATSKRPIVLVANQSNCLHLARFVRNNVITFSLPNSAEISRWLSLLTVAEQTFVPHNHCTDLYVHNRCDLRKTMLELQFYLQSGGDRSPKRVMGEAHHCDVMRFYVDQKCRSVNFESVQQNYAKYIVNSGGDLTTDVLDAYERFSGGLKLERPLDPDRIVSNLSEDIAYDFVERTWQTVSDHHSPTDDIRSSENVKSVWLADSIYVGDGAMQIGGAMRKRGIALDVEPLLRTICRSERVRTQTERRSSRFYHYLRSAATNSFSTDIFDRHCRVFQEETKKIDADDRDDDVC